MTKSAYAEQFTQGKPLLNDIKDKQIGRLERAISRDREAILEEWHDLAKAEAAVKERYRGRYLFELIQNANDAIADVGNSVSISELDARIRLELTRDSLLVANCGQPFAEMNVRALCRLHNTAKSVTKHIGHKGIGFKSVLEISKTPQVFSDIYAFTYSSERFGNEVAKVMGRQWHQDGLLPTLRMPYFCGLHDVSQEDRLRIERLFEDGFATVIRLPWDDKETSAAVAARIHEDIQPSLLLFLKDVQRIEISYPDGSEECFRRQTQPGTTMGVEHVLLYREQGNDVVQQSRWLLLGPIKREITDRSLVEDLDEAWQEVGAVRFALAVQLDRLTGRPILSPGSKPFYVYFPTQEPSGLRYLVHADFYVGDDRKTLSIRRLNEWLMEEICWYLASDGVDLLRKELGQSDELIELLAPVSRPEREFSQAFMRTYLSCLRESSFVPVDGAQYKEPYNTRFPPQAADQGRFRAIFPATKLRDGGKWAYATPAVIAAERARKAPFLLSPELGAEEITAQLLVDHLRQHGMPPMAKCREIITLFANWWENLPPQEGRRTFEGLVSQLPIFPTSRGWLRPGENTVFQANLRPGVPDLETPPGFDFAIIRRDAYSEAGYRSNEFRFFNALEAKDYSARDLIRDAILPTLTSPDALKKLLSEHPHSVLAAYTILFQYFQDERSSRDLADRLLRVLVPAWQQESQLEPVWMPAGECYLGRTWPGGRELEEVYSGFDDCFFVRDIPGLVLRDDEERVAWAGFLEWLGVARRPKLVAGGRKINNYSGDPFGDPRTWQDYLTERRQDFVCTNTAANHGERRHLTDVHALHHFADLVSMGDLIRLRRIYHLLAANWTGYYLELTNCTVRCEYERCPRDSVENYFLFSLRRLPWLEAALGSTRQLVAPSQIWTLGETEPQDVRSLVPTLAADMPQPIARELNAALGFMSSGTAQVEDYVRLLEFLVTQYPRNAWPAEFSERSRRTPLTTTFSWALERIQTGLVARGDQATDCPSGLSLLAGGKDGLEYLERESPRLVYADDPFMERRWQQHCAYLLCNDDWRRLRDWLGVPNLSSVVEAEWEIGTELGAETERIRARFSEMLPYFLALAYKRQPSAYERVLPRLRRLDLYVVDSLTARETINRLPEPVTISTPAQAYLRLREETRVRAGDLFCTPEVLENPDILGDYIAGYIEITGLADAFVLLMERDKDARERFVFGKGVTQEMLDRVRADLGEPESTVGEASKFVSMLVDRKMSSDNGVASGEQFGAGVSTGGAGQTAGIESPTGEIVHPPPKSYPPLSLETASSPVSAVEHPAAGPSAKNSGSGGGGTTIVVTGHETKEALGRRGEQWAYECEKHRLRSLGFDSDMPEYRGILEWVSARTPTSSYDIRSVDENLNDIYIEVKASSDRGRVIHLSLSELELALQKGEQYWLYWVGNVGAEQPDPPECYRDFASWLRDKKVTVDVDSLRITLRMPGASS